LKTKRDSLKIKRDSLFKKYVKNPNDYRLALEIKAIDDEIAECVRKQHESHKDFRFRRQRALMNS
jgi:hypothetical protein